MKRYILSIAAALATLCACGPSGEDNGGSSKPDDKPTASQVTITTTGGGNTTVGSGGDDVTVSFTASDSWTASVINNRADNWISVEPQSGAKGSGSVTVKVQPNETPDERNATIRISSGSASASFTVTQQQKDALTASSAKQSFEYGGGTLEITVNANVDFEYSIDSGSEWITYVTTKALKTNTLVFDIKANEETTRREGKITVKGKSGATSTTPNTFNIYQDGAAPAILLTRDIYEVSDNGDVIQVEVRSNVSVTAIIPSDVTWITEVTSKAMSTNTWYFEVTRNTSEVTRSAQIEFVNTDNNLSQKITVNQARSKTADPPGVYGLLGINWECSGNTRQSLLRTEDGTSRVVMFDTAQGKFFSISGLPMPADMEENARRTVTIFQNIDSEAAASSEVSLSVSKVSGSKVWLTASDSNYLIIKL